MSKGINTADGGANLPAPPQPQAPLVTDQLGRPLHTGPTTTTATAGTGSALPATPHGYLETLVNGALVKVPYYKP